MTKKVCHLPIAVTVAFGVVAATLFLLMGAPTPAEAASQTADEGLVLNGDEKCTRCHDEEHFPNVLTIGKTKHGTRADGRTPTCTTCHGPSDDHMASRSNKPDILFGKNSKTPASARSAVCLGCHSGKERMFWSTGMHAARNVSCDSCHKLHNNGHDKVRERKTEADVCFTCHKTQRIQAHRPSRHPILEGKVVCSDCHNPHGSAGDKNLARDTVNDTCYKCHPEKRGPFVWNHEPVTENCTNCHDPHGTTVANLLKWRSPFLCEQCHEPGTSHRGASPGFSTQTGHETGQMVLFARGCLNCHTNIHGSNNPRNTSGARSFRQ